MAEITVNSLKKEIEELKAKLEGKTRLSAKDKQLIIDSIAEKKREIEKLTKEEKQVTPVIGATVAERKVTRRSLFLGSGRVLL